ncbi:hypothetical protein DICPUDRAFT_151241 [Dictyostelium purpureum]|uniref:FAD-binding PCMH-type domain-containing protein n=1 Tax=Dictyostelium purpureum TaxID=5786 RepID=F0ZIC5_DICPU|nr:uncharacterized protein DICPUDRAFT_151241 [Dictyostelium purpureum]EGC36302.1 hypothetical protein DICPUDRAFT_151241 [Dictyostelium purpureum]|eukprot:XP_003287180.1 hypothetical protein DICPUDRAFT_151241 [Dictyostelium purpureum]
MATSCGAGEIVNNFCSSIEGNVLRKGSEEYKASLLNRWNLDVQNAPLLIVFPKNINDVVKAVNFSRECELDLAVKSGGHGISSACVNGLLIDFSKMKNIKVDPDTKTVRIEAGCTLGNLDDETSKFGLHIPSGHVSHTGLAGLTLGGGIGHLSRSLGLTSDSLLEITMVDYKGDILVVNEETNPELLYGMRGAGSNYGVVTEFVFKLHPVSNVYLGTFVYKHDNCKDALVKLGELASDPSTPNELSCAISITPEGVAVMAIYNGTEENGKEIIEKISTFGSPFVSRINMIPYVMLQKVIDDKVPHGLKYYQRGPFIKDSLNKEIVDIIIDSYNSHPTKSGAILLTHLGGKVRETPKDFSSFAHREAEYQIILLSIIPSDDTKQAIRQWTVDTHTKLSKYCFGDYSNTTDGSQPMTLVYGHCYDKLVELKNKYDPTNFFHNNANIKPSLDASNNM